MDSSTKTIDANEFTSRFLLNRSISNLTESFFSSTVNLGKDHPFAVHDGSPSLRGAPGRRMDVVQVRVASTTPQWTPSAFSAASIPSARSHRTIRCEVVKSISYFRTCPSLLLAYNSNLPLRRRPLPVHCREAERAAVPEEALVGRL